MIPSSAAWTATVRMQAVVESLRRQVLRQWLRAEAIQDFTGIPYQPDAPKLAWVVEDQPQISIQVEDQAMVCCKRRSLRFDPQIAAHAQMNQQNISR